MHTVRSIIAFFLVAATGAFAADSQTLLTSAANVRLRAAAGADAAVIAMLPLGTRLATSGPGQAEGWISVHVLREGGQQGWVDGSLAVPVTDATFAEVVSTLIATRLARIGDGIGARKELLDLIESTLKGKWSADQRSRLELQRLNALQGVLGAIPWNRKVWDTQLQDWLRDRDDEIRYNEPGGHWMIIPDLILARHDANRNTAAADEIAWFAVGNGLGGECEGYIVCYVERIDKLLGEYLRREPGGRHIDEAVDRILDTVELAARKQPGYVYHFDAASDCSGLKGGIAALGSAAQGSQASQRNLLAEKLRGLSSLCP